MNKFRNRLTERYTKMFKSKFNKKFTNLWDRAMMNSAAGWQTGRNISRGKSVMLHKKGMPDSNFFVGDSWF